MDDLNEMARLHSAGATVRHVSPFEHLHSHRNEFDLPGGFIKKWAVPYYMNIVSAEKEEWIKSIKNIKSEITNDISLSLLGDFNWRTRLVGAYFSAVRNYSDNIDIIGVHLLKSEVCCVGHIYALTLAFFNSEKSIKYLGDYLDYYLTKPLLYFDQDYVMGAILYLDEVNGTSNGDKYKENWNALSTIRKTKNDKWIPKFFEEQIQILKELNKYSS